MTPESLIKLGRVSGKGISKDGNQIVFGVSKYSFTTQKKTNNLYSVAIDGGELKKLSNYNINFSSNNFGIVEDCHLTIMHYISQYIRNLKFKDVNKISKINF